MIREILTIAFLVLFTGILFSIVRWSMKNGISPSPTSLKVLNCLKPLLPKPISGKIYELGSGWGHVVFFLAKEYPSLSITGFETSPIPYFVSKLWLKGIRQPPNVELLREDFFSHNLEDAVLVVCYLYPKAMERLQKKLEEELKPGTYVLTHTFALPGWQPDKVIDSDDLYHSKIYLYKVPIP